MNKCIYCGSENLEKELKTKGSKSIGNIHFQYSPMGMESEEILADLCKDCGSISRFYVKNTNRDWFKGFGK
jgi:predicted nucleic-acid-binding Zn-ribbon protein